PVLLTGPALSLESYFYTRQDKYSRIDVPSGKSATVKIIRWGGKKQSLFSPALIKKIKSTIDSNKSVLIFHNRRGYSYTALCATCGYVPLCSDCNDALKFFLDPPRLFCRRCFRETSPPDVCPECGSHNFLYPGVGIQKVAREAEELFPGIEVIRLDGNTGKKIDLDNPAILVGTRAVMSRVDWGKIGLCAVPSAGIHFGLEDFRASEKILQLLFRLRSYLPSESLMFIQVFNPDESAWKALKNDDPGIFYEEELSSRADASYPPFSHLVNLVVWISGENKESMAYSFWETFHNQGKKETWDAVGYFPLSVSGLGHRFLFIFRGKKVQEITSYLRNYLGKVGGKHGLLYKIDVDPVRFI
ncbi:MAG: hypothetical protein J7M18_07915, partial [Candidatus Eremiobacteraeota bacterium]|nr:hypothetical protein [Candidatus Eremiobacteraeota bacterium]